MKFNPVLRCPLEEYCFSLLQELNSDMRINLLWLTDYLVTYIFLIYQCIIRAPKQAFTQTHTRTHTHTQINGIELLLKETIISLF